jgi:hypothetical protein
MSRSLFSPGHALLLDAPPDLEEWAFDLLWQVVQWAAAMAAALCAQLTVSAAQQLKLFRAAKAAIVPA